MGTTGMVHTALVAEHMEQVSLRFVVVCSSLSMFEIHSGCVHRPPYGSRSSAATVPSLVTEVPLTEAEYSDLQGGGNSCQKDGKEAYGSRAATAGKGSSVRLRARDEHLSRRPMRALPAD